MRVLFHIFSLGAAQTPVALSAKSAHEVLKEPCKAGVPSFLYNNSIKTVQIVGEKINKCFKKAKEKPEILLYEESSKINRNKPVEGYCLKFCCPFWVLVLKILPVLQKLLFLYHFTVAYHSFFIGIVSLFFAFQQYKIHFCKTFLECAGVCSSD